MAGRKGKTRGGKVSTRPKAGIGVEKKRGRVENLRPAKPGEVRNPLGINGSTWLKEFRDYFGGAVGDDAELTRALKKFARPGERRIDAVKRALFVKAVFGGDAAQKLVVEQMQGRARQHVELTGPGGVPLAPPAVVRLYLPPNGRDIAAPPAAPMATAPAASDDPGADADGE